MNDCEPQTCGVLGVGVGGCSLASSGYKAPWQQRHTLRYFCRSQGQASAEMSQCVALSAGSMGACPHLFVWTSKDVTCQYQVFAYKQQQGDLYAVGIRMQTRRSEGVMGPGCDANRTRTRFQITLLEQAVCRVCTKPTRQDLFWGLSVDSKFDLPEMLVVAFNIQWTPCLTSPKLADWTHASGRPIKVTSHKSNLVESLLAEDPSSVIWRYTTTTTSLGVHPSYNSSTRFNRTTMRSLHTNM